MRRIILVLLLVAGTAAVAAAGEDRGLDSGLVNPGYEEKPAWFKDSFLDLREDITEAAASGRRVMLYFYQDGCPYCARLLQDNFGDRRLAESARLGFDVVAINMWGDREVTGLDGAVTTEKSFARGLKVQFTPTLLFLDETGKTVLRVNGYLPPERFGVALDYVAGRHEDIPFGQFLAAAKPVPATGRLHREPGFMEAPLTLSGPRQRPLLVLFEQRQCAGCDELHLDILRRPEVRESLEGFDIAVLDMWSSDELTTPAGERRKARDWARELGILYAPTLVFFDAGGHEVFRTEAYLRAFHVHGALDYVRSGDYRNQPEFQRYLQERRARLEEQGIRVDLWE